MGYGTVDLVSLHMVVIMFGVNRHQPSQYWVPAEPMHCLLDSRMRLEGHEGQLLGCLLGAEDWAPGLSVSALR